MLWSTHLILKILGIIKMLSLSDQDSAFIIKAKDKSLKIKSREWNGK